MTSIVIDASILVKIYINEKDSAVALSLIERESLNLEVPDILATEVINTLTKHERNGLLAVSLVDRAVRDIVMLAPRLVPSSLLLSDAITIARSMRHLFNCMYLTLAERFGIDFVTADEEFAERCRNRIPSRARRVVLLRESAS